MATKLEQAMMAGSKVSLADIWDEFLTDFEHEEEWGSWELVTPATFKAGDRAVDMMLTLWWSHGVTPKGEETKHHHIGVSVHFDNENVPDYLDMALSQGTPAGQEELEYFCEAFGVQQNAVVWEVCTT
jgi:hypothetical protein